MDLTACELRISHSGVRGSGGRGLNCARASPVLAPLAACGGSGPLGPDGSSPAVPMEFRLRSEVVAGSFCFCHQQSAERFCHREAAAHSAGPWQSAGRPPHSEHCPERSEGEARDRLSGDRIAPAAPASPSFPLQQAGEGGRIAIKSTRPLLTSLRSAPPPALLPLPVARSGRRVHPNQVGGLLRLCNCEFEH